jgi:hypothetical protein
VPSITRALSALSLSSNGTMCVRASCACCVQKWVSSSFLCRTTLHAVCGRWTCVWVWVARCRVVACTVAYLSLFLLRLISLGERRRTPTGTQAPCHSRSKGCARKNGFIMVFILFLYYFNILFYTFFAAAMQRAACQCMFGMWTQLKLESCFLQQFSPLRLKVRVARGPSRGQCCDVHGSQFWVTRSRLRWALLPTPQPA